MSRKENSRDPEATAAENVTSEAQAQNAADGPSVEKIVSDELEKLAAEKADLKNTLLRLQADFDNYRKRIDRERHHDRHRGAEVLVENLLPVLDGFDRAISAHRDAAHDEFRKGFELIRKQMLDVLSKQGLQKIETEGKPFDPNFHHAIERVETSDQLDDTVLEELQAGYVFHGKVLRPAMVRVAANPQGHGAASNSSSRGN
ncbi:MAG TPA: nucleotide exchange factor GrpE [Candidatus Acidoferrales bacterium]|nr:nucleotide exchange factor GrpE [Candidatus Acidoferrales bacterium]